ncbi:DUF2306 domain-containing protein [Mycolicibacterium sp. XJ870]
MTYATRAPRWLAPALALVVLAFLAYSLPPYFTGGTRVPSTFGLHYPLLVGHVMCGTVAMIAAVVQLWPGLRRRHSQLHRRAGRIYVWTAVPAAVCAVVIGAASPFGPILAVSNVVLGTLWLWLTIGAYLAARQRRFAEHRRLMIFSVTLTLSIITNRIWTPIVFIALLPLQDSMFGGDEERYIWLVAGLVGWLGWTLPLGAVWWWLNRESKAVSPPVPAGQRL